METNSVLSGSGSTDELETSPRSVDWAAIEHDVIEGTGGLRKLWHGDPRRGKGKRGGLRVIYYWWDSGAQFWLFTLYDKDEMDDLDAKMKRAFRDGLKTQLEKRR